MTQPSGPGAAYCPSCGGTFGPDATVSHDRCVHRQAYEPPRFCGECGRRMVVQVTPMSWTATCSRHGRTSSG